MHESRRSPLVGDVVEATRVAAVAPAVFQGGEGVGGGGTLLGAPLLRTGRAVTSGSSCCGMTELPSLRDHVAWHR
jgi:hypothetical protein